MSQAPVDDTLLPTGGVRHASQRAQLVHWALKDGENASGRVGLGKDSRLVEEAEAGRQDVL